MKRSAWRTCSRTSVLFSTALCVSLLCACSDEDPSGGPSDAASDVVVDAGTDSPPPADAGKDVIQDGPAEAAPDAPVDVQTDTPQDVQPDTPTGTAFLLFVTESPPGPDNQNPTVWRGVQRYGLTGSGAEMVAGANIDKDAVADPAGLAYSETLSEIFVGNRHGNVSADGTAGSISRFQYDKGTQTLTPNGTITGNGLNAVHQLVFHPTTGDLFAANYKGGVSRFTFGSGGEAIPDGTLSDGVSLGVAVSPDGSKLYVTTSSNLIRQFNLLNDTELPSVTLPTTANLHYLEVHDGELYAAALFDNKIYRFTIESDTLTLRDNFVASSPVGIAFSPDGLEMFVSGHLSSDLINRFAYDSVQDSWTSSGSISTTVSLCDLVVVQ